MEINDKQAIVVKLLEEEKYAVGFAGWLLDVEIKDIAKYIEKGTELTIQWPNKNFKDTATFKKAKNVKWTEKAVKIIKFGGVARMLEEQEILGKNSRSDGTKTTRSSKVSSAPVKNPKQVPGMKRPSKNGDGTDAKKQKKSDDQKKKDEEEKNIMAQIRHEELLKELKKKKSDHQDSLYSDSEEEDENTKGDVSKRSRAAKSKENSNKDIPKINLCHDSDDSSEEESDDDGVDDSNVLEAIKKLEAETASDNNMFKALKEKVSEQEGIISELYDEIERKTNETKRLKKNLELLTSDLKNKNDECKLLQEKLKNVESGRTKIMTEILSLEQISKNLRLLHGLPAIKLIENTSDQHPIQPNPAAFSKDEVLNSNFPSFGIDGGFKSGSLGKNDGLTHSESKEKEEVYIIPESILKKASKANISELCKDLISKLFTPEELSSSSISGKVCNANLEKYRSDPTSLPPPKPALNPAKKKAIKKFCLGFFPNTGDNSKLINLLFRNAVSNKKKNTSA